MAYWQHAFGFEDFRQHDPAHSVELGLVPEKAGFSNRNFVEKAHHLWLADWLDGEALVVVPKCRGTDFLHAALATIFQKAKLVVGLEYAGDLIDKIPNFDQKRVGWTDAGSGWGRADWS